MKVRGWRLEIGELGVAASECSIKAQSPPPKKSKKSVAIGF